MNKYIEHDLNNGIALIKVAVYNILNALDSGEIDTYSIKKSISREFIEECMNELGWTDNTTNSGKMYQIMEGLNTYIIHTSTSINKLNSILYDTWFT